MIIENKKNKKRLSGQDLYATYQYVKIIREAKTKGNKFSLEEMSYSSFFNIKTLKEYKFNKNAICIKVKIGDIKVKKIQETENNDADQQN